MGATNDIDMRHECAVVRRFRVSRLLVQLSPYNSYMYRHASQQLSTWTYHTQELMKFCLLNRIPRCATGTVIGPSLLPFPERRGPEKRYVAADRQLPDHVNRQKRRWDNVICIGNDHIGLVSRRFSFHAITFCEGD